jgi:hypothetical protein
VPGRWRSVLAGPVVTKTDPSGCPLCENGKFFTVEMQTNDN